MEEMVRLLIDMDNKSEIGVIDWEFIHDMQGIAPEIITPEIIHLTREFLEKIPPKWDKIKEKLKGHLKSKQPVHIAIADIENMGNEFKLRGTFHSPDGEPLDFHKVVIYDKDRFEDDYIGAVITDKEGRFSLAFGKKTFSDFGLEAEPDIYFKVFSWDNERFLEIGKIMPSVHERIETEGKKIIYEFGVINIQ
jgi:hypothetical protein